MKIQSNLIEHRRATRQPVAARSFAPGVSHQIVQSAILNSAGQTLALQRIDGLLGMVRVRDRGLQKTEVVLNPVVRGQSCANLRRLVEILLADRFEHLGFHAEKLPASSRSRRSMLQIGGLWKMAGLYERLAGVCFAGEQLDLIRLSAYTQWLSAWNSADWYASTGRPRVRPRLLPPLSVAPAYPLATRGTPSPC